MLTIKIRSAVITLIAASSLALAIGPLAPVVSAQTNQKGTGHGPWKNTCANAQVSFENALTLTEGLAEEGDTKGADKALKLAQKIYTNATRSGCSIRA